MNGRDCKYRIGGNTHHFTRVHASIAGCEVETSSMNPKWSNQLSSLAITNTACASCARVDAEARGQRLAALGAYSHAA